MTRDNLETSNGDLRIKSIELLFKASDSIATMQMRLSYFLIIANSTAIASCVLALKDFGNRIHEWAIFVSILIFSIGLLGGMILYLGMGDRLRVIGYKVIDLTLNKNDLSEFDHEMTKIEVKDRIADAAGISSIICTVLGAAIVLIDALVMHFFLHNKPICDIYCFAAPA